MSTTSQTTSGRAVASRHRPPSIEPELVVYEGVASVRLPGDDIERLPVELVGGRNRHSVGGRIAEGTRWWRGQLAAQGGAIEITPGTTIHLELRDGTVAAAVVERSSTPHHVRVRGLGPPPFAVP